MTLSDSEKKYYSRQIALPGFGTEAQEKLRESSVLVIGAGGLGSGSLPYLAGAGVGTIGVMDGDLVELNNLHRQILFDYTSTGKPKAKVAEQKLKAINPHIEINAYPYTLEPGNALEMFEKYDIIIDGTDNFNARYLINDAAFFCGKPVVFASIHRYEGQLAVFNTDTGDGRRSPNYRDVFPFPPSDELVANCAEAGVLGVLPGIFGTYQALEAIKLITGLGEPLVGKMMMSDLLKSNTDVIEIAANPKNPLSGPDAAITSLQDYDYGCEVNIPEVPFLSPDQLYTMRQIVKTRVVDIREEFEVNVDTIGGEWHPQSESVDWWKSIPRDEAIVVYCEKGNRSAYLVRDITEVDPERKVFNLAGGIKAWRSKYGDENLPENKK